MFLCKNNCMKKVLVSGYIGFNNFGDELIFNILKEHLKSLNCDVSALSASNNYDIKTYNYKNIPEIITAILKCDILISGGGSLLQNKTSNFSLLYYLSIIFLAKLFFKKVIIFAQGIEPIKGKAFQFLTKNILKICDFISVRDKKSHELLKTWKINSTLVCDPAFSIADKTEPSKNKKGIILQLRKVNGVNNDYIRELASIIVKYQKEIKVLALQEKYDKDICFTFINEFKKLGGSADYIYNEDINKTIDAINNCEYIISTRLHGLIVACVLKCKVFALSYDDKIKTLTEELNISNINLYNYSFEELNNKIEKFMSSNCREYTHRNFSWDDTDKAIIA